MHSQVSKKRQTRALPSVEERLLGYLARFPSGLSPARMYAWVNSVTLQGGYTLSEFDSALRTLRDSGRIAFNSERFYLRNQKTNPTES